ncbi:hypothetical protein [Lysinibacillus sphaericus]|nr:hypothetical protein [Lysinibacillus sphaericus]
MNVYLFSNSLEVVGAAPGLITKSMNDKRCCHNVYRLWNIFHDILEPL